MSDNTIIKTTKRIYPQIYAYILPEYTPKDGWIKIGYTERREADTRIKEQTHTAAVNLKYAKLWAEPARFSDSGEWFKDAQLHAYLRKIKQVKQEANSEWFYYNGMPEQAHRDFLDFRDNRYIRSPKTGSQLPYVLRAEQEQAVEKALAYAMSHENGEFLWNAKPRFGKTLAAYDLARRMNARKVLIVTNRPAIANSWFDDFEAFVAWQTKYSFISTADSLKERPVFTREEFLAQLAAAPIGVRSDSHVTFISLQDLKGAIPFGGVFDKLVWVKELQWDLLIIDEAHEGADTLKADVALNNIKRRFTLHLSGTPFKAVASGRFTEEQVFNWTYADEQSAKAGWADVSQNNPYEKLPKMNLFSYQMSQMISGEASLGAGIDGADTDFAFDLNEFFATGEAGRFVHEAEVRKWLDTLTRNEKYPFSTPVLRNELRHTLWLLSRVASAKALAALLREHPVFENYELVLAVGSGREQDDVAASERALNRLRAAIREHDKTITLSVGQLTTGVTVPEWSAVLMLSNVKSPSLYMQAAFRAQSPWEYDKAGEMRQKRNAYVFDFAPERTLLIYDEFANNLSGRAAGDTDTTHTREENIRTLLNFFPVIAEDADGKMTELDVRQVLCIPKTIKAREVVRRGFMSNLLFQNISGIFASSEAREILEQLSPVVAGKVAMRHAQDGIDTRGVKVDSSGEVEVAASIVIAETDARLDNKVYASIACVAQQADLRQVDAGLAAEHPASGQPELAQLGSCIAGAAAAAFIDEVLVAAKELARDHAVSVAQAERLVRENAEAVARDVEVVARMADIKRSEAKVELERQLAASQGDETAVSEARQRFAASQERIQGEFQQDLLSATEASARAMAERTAGAILAKAEEKKKTAAEDDVRARLRGFARTIPSFLMAYGSEDTTLANFDECVSDEVFKDVTGITTAQFRALRDTYCFFDRSVFDESVQEFMCKKEQLADYLSDNLGEDIFDYIPPQRTNQIFTPRKIVEMMVSKLEDENPGIFQDKRKTFADLYVKSGMFLTEIAKRLFAGLAEQIPDAEQRRRHILENQLYGFAPSEIIHSIAKSYVFGTCPELDSSHIVCRDLTDTAQEEGGLDMEFDVVVGNPPYQQSGEARDEPIYHHFYDLAERVARKYCLISPARFLFNAGQTPKLWNAKMLNDEHLKVEFYEQNSASVFANTDIKGGIAVVYRDSDRVFGRIGAFTHYSELNSIVAKVAAHGDTAFSTIVQPQGIYRFSEQFFVDFPQAEEMQGKGTKNKIVSKSFAKMSFAFSSEKTAGDEICMLGLVGGKREYKWVSRKHLVLPDSFGTYRVFIPEANGTGAIGEVPSTPLVGEPLVGHTDTFLTVGAYATEQEAIAVMRYIKTKFARALLGVLKITQHNSRSTWAKVPLQDFTMQSDIDWTKPISQIDQQLYDKYGLTEAEVSFIEEKITAME